MWVKIELVDTYQVVSEQVFSKYYLLLRSSRRMVYLLSRLIRSFGFTEAGLVF